MSKASAVVAIFAIVVGVALFLAWQVRSPHYLDATGIVPQVVTCIDPKPAHKSETIVVKLRTERKKGRISAYHFLGCTWYYYHFYEEL